MLKQYENSCEKLAQKFIKEVFETPVVHHWVGDRIGEVLYVDVYFINMDNIANYFRYHLTPDDFFEWYEENLENGVSMKHFKQR